MVHTIETDHQNEISIIERGDKVRIWVCEGDKTAVIQLDADELYSFIGTLLHVQAKMRQ